MTLAELKNQISPYYPAIVLDSVLSRNARKKAEDFSVIGLVLFAFLQLLTVISPIFKNINGFLADLIVKLNSFSTAIFGILLIVFSFWIVTQMLKAYYASYYYRGLEPTLPELGLTGAEIGISFEASSVIFEILRSGDFTNAFLNSRLGRYSLIRLGVDRGALKDFFAHKAILKDSGLFVIENVADGEKIGLRHIAQSIYHADHEFSKFLSFQNISLKDLEGATSWVERNDARFMIYQRFWGKDALGRIPGIGKTWAYGGAYTLEKFAQDITDSSRNELTKVEIAEEGELEAVLSRSGESNVILVSEEGGGAMGVIAGLGAKIKKGSVLPPLEHKRIYLFDANSFVASTKTKAVFESKFIRILNESVKAGNIILVIPSLPDFIQSARSIGSEVVPLLDPYLALPNFQVIAISSPGAFHASLEQESKILHRFEKILIKDEDRESIVKILEDEALRHESRSGLFFTYQSLDAVAESTERYFGGDGVASSKAIHLLSEVASKSIAKKKPFIEKSDVLESVEAKTGIPTGEVSGEERQKLLRLEEVLHERVIGQDEAVKAISDAMRRARSDIENPERPMGSFLFLGPTGVGKTETAKALSAAFFGNENSIIRLDMTEYQTDDALKRLVGSFEGGKAGVLSSRLREQPYGVLLLDEFEKTSREVLDLFLQILDEGFFSDMSGKRVNARNLIIIATSNAGSDLIWEKLHGTDSEQERGINTEGEKKLDKNAIVNEIIKRGIFKPELLNRFDGVILFHPLGSADLQRIATLMLQKLKKRLTEKGIDLVINDALLRAVTSAGTDPQFGARPMNRAIQEKVEQAVAKRIIAGEANPGSRVELTFDELA